MGIEVDRRQFLQGLGISLAALPLAAQAAQSQQQLHVLAAYDVGRNEHRFGLAGAAANVSLPERGHHICRVPGKPDECLVFARRPGSYIARINWRKAELLARYDYADNRHGFGHGVFLPDGRLATTDNDIDTGAGLITLRHPQTLEPLAEFSSGGIGPHELLVLDAKILLVANGGILTLPESGRIKLNLREMQPSLDVVALDGSGSRASWQLPDKRLSIRHLAHATDDCYAVALQFEGRGAAPVLARWQAGSLQALDIPDAALAEACNGYAASAAASPQTLACTATKGDAVLAWRRDGSFLAAHEIAKPAGIALTPDGRHFIVSNEYGEIRWLFSDSLREDLPRRRRYPLKWDNHLSLFQG